MQLRTLSRRPSSLLYLIFQARPLARTRQIRMAQNTQALYNAERDILTRVSHLDRPVDHGKADGTAGYQGVYRPSLPSRLLEATP